MRSRLLCLLALLAGAPWGALQASWFGAQFSAEAVQRRPGKPPMTGKMYVGKGRLRTEFHRGNRTMVEIVNPSAGKAYLLFPQQKRYVERPLPPSARGLAKRSAGTNPCAGMKGVTCRDLGKVTLNGRRAEKWAMSGTVEGRTVHGTQWIDLQHHFPLRREFEGKVTFDLRYEGKATVEGRPVEKWVSTAIGPHGRSMKVTQWYDPGLNVAIRQETPSGYVRELRNIRVGPQPERLFDVPSGYQRIELPAASGR